MTGSVTKAHRLLAPRVAYLIGTRDHNGTTNVIPVSNVTSASTDPQHVLLAIYKQWRTHDVLLDAAGFTLSVPLIGHLEGAWILAAKYSHYLAANPREKITASGLTFDYNASPYGPVLVDSIGWMDCHVIERIDLGGDHRIIIGQAQRVWFNPEFLDSEGIPHAQISPLMQVTGNLFTTASRLQQVPPTTIKILNNEAVVDALRWLRDYSTVHPLRSRRARSAAPPGRRYPWRDPLRAGPAAGR